MQSCFTLRDLFLASVEKAPDKVFLSDKQRSFTYHQTLEASSSRAHLLLNVGGTCGERLLIVDTDPVETSLWLLACSLIGMPFLIFHADTPPRRIEAALKSIEPMGIVDTRAAYNELYQGKSTLRFLSTSTCGENTPLPRNIPDAPDIVATDPAFLVYTSGSTKEPRAVICSHRAALAVTSSVNMYLLNSSEDRIGHLLSLSFVYGLYQLFLTMQAQASIVFLGKFRSPTELIAQLREYRITGFPALRLILTHLTRLENTQLQLETLRYITCAGEALPTALIKNVLSTFPHIPFFYMYGQTECARALYMPPERLASKPASVGRAIPGTRAFLVNEAGAPATPGEVGELIIEGPHVMSGYWNAPEETRARFFQGPYGQPRLRTGDIFTQDGEGDFYFVSRKDDLLKSRGFRISPREVECLIQQADPAISECLVYGVEDEILGQAIHAQVVVNDPSHGERAILMRCRTSMDPHFIPAKVQVVTALPTTPSGKYFRPR
jgi:long-chain acyl-CoA synthetase